jgi:uncharacterized protein
MKTLTSRLLAAVSTLMIAHPALAEEKPPAGAAEKIAQALPEKAYAKPEKPRKLLVFSKTNGFRHASIATGKLALTEMGRKTGAFETTLSEDLANSKSTTSRNSTPSASSAPP